MKKLALGLVVIIGLMNFAAATTEPMDCKGNSIRYKKKQMVVFRDINTQKVKGCPVIVTRRNIMSDDSKITVGRLMVVDKLDGEEKCMYEFGSFQYSDTNKTTKFHAIIPCTPISKNN